MSLAYHFYADHRGWYLREPYSEGFRPRHARVPAARRIVRRLAALAVVPLIWLMSSLGSTAHAATADSGPPSGSSHAACTWRCYPRNEAMSWALTQKGHPYQWGGTGPGYDCSGLVMMAYRHAGFSLPRTTYEMLGSVGVRHYRRHIWWVLVRVLHPKRGDLAFYGSGHVELDTRLRHETFGAHDSGSPVSYARWGWGWVPTEFLRLVVHRRR